MRKVCLPLLAGLLAVVAARASAELNESYDHAQAVLHQGPGQSDVKAIPVACNPNIEDCPPPSACNPNIEDCGRPTPPPACNPNIENCGGIPVPPVLAPICSVAGYYGRTMEEAIAACSASNTPFTVKQCANSGVVCNRGAYPIRMCVSGADMYFGATRTDGLPGTSVAEAINKCGVLTDIAWKDCTSHVTCKGAGQICFANGMAGDDIHSAAQNCDKYTDMTLSNCYASAYCTPAQSW